MPDKLDRCVDDIKAKGDADGVNPWAVCNASIGEIKPEDSEKLLHEIDDMIAKQASFPASNSSFKHKTGGLTTKLRPNTFGNTAADETVSIPGSLSAVKIKGKKREGSSMMQEVVFKSVLDTKLNSCGCSKKKLKIKETRQASNVFIKQLVERRLMQEVDDDIQWITVKGAHIPIKKGQSKDDAVKDFFSKQKGDGSKKIGDMSEKDLIKSIKGESKDWHDWDRNEKTEDAYAEIERRNKEIPKPKRPEGAGGTIFQDDPDAIEKYEKKIKYLEDIGEYWKEVTKFPARDYHTRPTQLGDAKWYEMSNNSQNLNTTRKKLAKVKERKESGTTLERKVTYKGGKPRFYYKENPKEGTSETTDTPDPYKKQIMETQLDEQG